MKSKGIILLLGILLAMPAVAQHTPPKADTARFGAAEDVSRIFQDYMYGVVKSIGKSEMVLDKTVLGDGQVFQLSPKTKFFQDRKPSTLENFKAGDPVWVEMKKDKAGNMQARKVYTGLAPTNQPR